MDNSATLTVAALVVALTTFAKWTGVPDKRGPYVVILLSAVGVILYSYSEGLFARQRTFELVAAFVAVLLQAAGVFGFTRAAPEAVSSFSKPTDQGAGNNPTQKM